MAPSRAPRAPAVRAELVPAGDTAVAAAPPPASPRRPCAHYVNLTAFRLPLYVSQRSPVHTRARPPPRTARISGRDTRREI